jgi:hypothetical protein
MRQGIVLRDTVLPPLRVVLALLLLSGVSCGPWHSPIPRASPSAEWNCSFDVHAEDAEIILLPGVAVSKHLLGTVRPLRGNEWLVGNQPTFVVWAHETGTLRHSNPVALDGRIVSRDLPAGQYCFRASAVGFGSVIGRLRIDPTAADTPLDVRLPLAK